MSVCRPSNLSAQSISECNCRKQGRYKNVRRQRQYASALPQRKSHVQAPIKIVADGVIDGQAKRDIMRVYDELNSCPSNSNSATDSIDENIFKEIEYLELAVDSDDSNGIKKSCAKLLTLSKERKEFSKF